MRNLLDHYLITKELIICIILLFVNALVSITAQTGGKAFQFLENTNSARIASLGGKVVSSNDDDLNFAFFNPALLSSNSNHNLVLNYINYFAGINYGYASYASQYKNCGMFAAGIHFLNYGNFQGADESGFKTNKFRASEYALHLIHSRKIDSSFTIGITAKPIFSYLETYFSLALAFDAGILYESPDNFFTASLVMRNLGMQINSYSGNEREALPFEIILGISKQLQHAPFRFYLLADHIEKPNLSFKSEIDIEKSIDPLTGDVKKTNNFDDSLDKILRHFVLGTEFILSENLMFRVGYNYRRRQEMKLDTKTGTVGISWGFGLRIKKFHISYARSAFHLAGSPNYFSISMNLDEFKNNF